MLYLIDANMLIDASRDYYPINRFPEFWDWLVALGERGQVKVPREVYEKVTSGSDELSQWLKDNKDVLQLPEEPEIGLLRQVVSEGYAPDLTDAELEKLNEDPFLLAYALADARQRCVVTTEISKRKRTLFPPSVAISTRPAVTRLTSYANSIFARIGSHRHRSCH